MRSLLSIQVIKCVKSVLDLCTKTKHHLDFPPGYLPLGTALPHKVACSTNRDDLLHWDVNVRERVTIEPDILANEQEFVTCCE